MLLNIIRTSSGVMGGPRRPAEESEAVDTVRDDDEDDKDGGDEGIGMFSGTC